MQFLIRWLVISGGAAIVARLASGPLRAATDGRIVRAGFLVLAGSWVLTIGDAFVPVMTAPPLGLLLFLLATAVSIVAAVAAVLLAVLVGLRRTGRVPAPAGSPRLGLGLVGLLAAGAVVSFFGERVLSIVAAVHN